MAVSNVGVVITIWSKSCRICELLCVSVRCSETHPFPLALNEDAEASVVHCVDIQTLRHFNILQTISCMTVDTMAGCNSISRINNTVSYGRNSRVTQSSIRGFWNQHPPSNILLWKGAVAMECTNLFLCSFTSAHETQSSRNSPNFNQFQCYNCKEGRLAAGSAPSPSVSSTISL
jgi:hypothetical protein